MEIVKLFFEGKSQYNVITNLLPGALICISLKRLAEIDLMAGEYLQDFCVCFFAGIVNNCLASVLVEWVCKKCKIVEFASYCDYLEAEKIDNKLQILSAENNAYRNYISMFIIVLFASLLKDSFANPAHEYVWKVVLLILLVILFVLAYRKRTKYIKDRVEKVKVQQDATVEHAV